MVNMNGGYCHDDLWNWSITWKTEIPDFTLCFQDTFFVLTPCIFFCVIALGSIWHISRNLVPAPLPWTAFNATKLVICICLVVLSSTSFAIAIQNKLENAAASSAIISSCAQSVSFIIVIVVMLIHKQYGVRSSALLSVFWLCLSFSGIIIYRSSFLRFYGKVFPDLPKGIFRINMVYFPLIFIELCLSFFADAKTYDRFEEGSPMDDAPFFSYVTFFWFTRVLYKGAKQQLNVEDFPPLSVRQKAHYLWDKFQSKWKFSSIKPEQLSSESNAASQKTPSLAWGLITAFWPWIFYSCIFNILCDISSLTTPLILNLIIDFISNDEYLWRGYLYCGAIVVTDFIQKLLFNHFIFLALNFAGQIKSALTEAVYRKCLKISNSTREEYASGALTNLVSVDVERVVNFALFFSSLFIAPLKIALTIVLLWQYLGPSCLAGVVVIALLIPLTLVSTRISERLYEKQMKMKDTRLKYMNEILSGMKVLKLYAWEIPFMAKITDTRQKEVRLTRLSQFCYVSMNFVFNCAPILVAISSFTTYLLVDETHVLSPSTAFVSLNLMNSLKYALFELPDTISELIQTNISLGRLRKFFTSEEYNVDVVGINPKKGEVLTINDATFSWVHDSEPTLKNIDLHVEMGKLVAVIGAVGSGKSSLLSATLGEMYKMSGSIDMKGSLAYVPQQAWILNRSVKQNILLVKPMQEGKYDEIVEKCCLKPDLEILPGRDETEIGEKGVNLSGGQKQRISLARAVFQNADVYLLDDPLSAVDAHVRKDLFENVIGNTGLLRKKTRILVTHDISILPSCDVIVSMKNGKIEEIGTYSELLSNNGCFKEFIKEHANPDVAEEAENETIDLDSILKRLESRESQKSGVSLERTISTDSSLKQIQHKTMKDIGMKLTEEEKMEVGKVSRGVYLGYLKQAGISLFIPAILGILSFEAFEIGSNVWLSKWSADADLNATNSSPSKALRIGVYGALGFGQAVSSITGTLFLVFASTRASVLYHRKMLQSVMRSPMSFFDSTPFGRIMNRFSTDMDVIDVQIVYQIDGWMQCLVAVFGVFIVVGMNLPIFLAALIPIIIVYYVIQKFYLITSRQIKRLESITRSPIYSHFLESIQGVSSIKAYNVGCQFIEKLESNLNTHISCFFLGGACNRWLAFWLSILGDVVITISTFLAIENRGVLSAAVVGLTISYAISVTEALLWLVRCNTDLENKSVSVERLEEYCNLPSEASWDVPDKDPVPEWPKNGSIQFEDYSTRYREGLDLVLKSISLEVLPNEKVGIVGRTGAGKSSVTLALFRLIEPAEGQIVIDDVDVSKIGLHALRSKLTIIPQDPVLFTGTVRLNLDPNDEYNDDEIWQSLKQAHLKNFVANLVEGLNYDLTEGGENLSVGQRQLICLARALLKRTKILVLDEATAAVDMDTDRLIQNTIRTEFAKHTVITIAHRLNTIMDYDKIVVMDAGRISEVGNPAALLQDSESKFYHMAKDAGLI